MAAHVIKYRIWDGTRPVILNGAAAFGVNQIYEGVEILNITAAGEANDL